MWRSVAMGPTIVKFLPSVSLGSCLGPQSASLGTIFTKTLGWNSSAATSSLGCCENLKNVISCHVFCLSGHNDCNHTPSYFYPCHSQPYPEPPTLASGTSALTFTNATHPHSCYSLSPLQLLILSFFPTSTTFTCQYHLLFPLLFFPATTNHTHPSLSLLSLSCFPLTLIPAVRSNFYHSPTFYMFPFQALSFLQLSC